MKDTKKVTIKLGEDVLISEFDTIERYQVFNIMWRAVLSIQLNDAEQIKALITKYHLFIPINQANAFLKSHQKRLQIIWNACKNGSVPPQEEWEYIQQHLKKNLHCNYGYELVPDPKDHKKRLIIYRKHQPKGVIAVLYFSFMEAVLAATNTHNLSMLTRSFNQCITCKRFYDPNVFYKSLKYCSQYCQIEFKKTTQQANYRKFKKK